MELCWVEIGIREGGGGGEGAEEEGRCWPAPVISGRQSEHSVEGQGEGG